jgi:hypothetical protein
VEPLYNINHAQNIRSIFFNDGGIEDLALDGYRITLSSRTLFSACADFFFFVNIEQQKPYRSSTGRNYAGCLLSSFLSPAFSPLDTRSFTMYN